jgi:hypothetical protein
MQKLKDLWWFRGAHVTSDAQISLDHAKYESMALRARLTERLLEKRPLVVPRLPTARREELVVGFSSFAWQIGDFHDVLLHTSYWLGQQLSSSQQLPPRSSHPAKTALLCLRPIAPSAQTEVATSNTMLRVVIRPTNSRS